MPGKAAHPVTSTSEVAAGLQYLCDALVREDFAAAYWFLRSHEAAGDDVPLPSWLLAALQASRWRPDEDLAVAADLLQIASSHSPSDELAAQLLAISAALLPALTQPLVDVTHWLVKIERLPRFSELVNGVRGYAERGQKVPCSYLGTRLSREQTEQELHQIVTVAGAWLDHASDRTTSFQRASGVWKHLVKADDQLRVIILPVARDRRREAGSVVRGVGKWSRRNFIVERVHDLDAELTKSRRVPIQGSALEQIVSWTYETSEIAQRWCELVQRLQRLQSPTSWLEQQVEVLRTTVGLALPRAVKELQSVMDSGEALPRAAASVAACSLHELAQLLEIEVPDAPVVRQDAVLRLALNGYPPRGLWHGLARRLLWLPELELTDDCQPTQAALPQVAAVFEGTAHQSLSLTVAMRGWLEKQDFRFTDTLLEMLQDSESWHALAEEHRARLETAQQELEACRAVLEQRIENGVIDGVLFERKRAEFQEWLLALNASTVRDFPAARRACDDVSSELDRAYAEHCAAQRSEWELQRGQLLSSCNAAERERITQMVETALARGDARLVHEYLSQLQAAHVKGYSPVLTSPATARSTLEEFLGSYERLADVARQRNGLENGGYRRLIQRAGAPSGLSDARLEEACRALEVWSQLSQKRLSNNDPRIKVCIASLLESLGLRSVDSTPEVELMKAGRNWAHVQAHVSDNLLSPVPQFGSLRRESYDLLCVWDNPSAQSLLATQ